MKTSRKINVMIYKYLTMLGQVKNLRLSNRLNAKHEASDLSIALSKLHSAITTEILTARFGNPDRKGRLQYSQEQFDQTRSNLSKFIAFADTHRPCKLSNMIDTHFMTGRAESFSLFARCYVGTHEIASRLDIDSDYSTFKRSEISIGVSYFNDIEDGGDFMIKASNIVKQNKPHEFVSNDILEYAAKNDMQLVFELGGSAHEGWLNVILTKNK